MDFLAILLAVVWPLRALGDHKDFAKTPEGLRAPAPAPLLNGPLLTIGGIPVSWAVLGMLRNSLGGSAKNSGGFLGRAFAGRGHKTIRNTDISENIHDICLGWKELPVVTGRAGSCEEQCQTTLGMQCHERRQHVLDTSYEACKCYAETHSSFRVLPEVDATGSVGAGCLQQEDDSFVFNAGSKKRGCEAPIHTTNMAAKICVCQ